MKKIIKKIYYIGGTIYRGLIGIFHNTFDKCEKINSEIESRGLGIVVGKSVGGRNIFCYKIIFITSTGSFVANSKRPAPQDRIKKILIVGGIHGNEVGTVKLAKKIVNYYFNKAPAKRLEPTDKNLNIELFIIPVLNIDGYTKAIKNPDYFYRGKVGRFNSNNVDLNRNFPTKNFQSKSVWKTGKNYSEKSQEVFCGEFGASELETKSLINFIKKENIQNLIMLHNVGKDVMINKDDKVAENWARIYNKYSKFKKRFDMNLDGGASDWARENKIHFIAVEGSSRWGSDWARQGNAIFEILKNL